MKKFFFLTILIASLAFITKDELTGRWESKSVTGNITGVIFNPDNSFEGYINKKPFVSGTYTFKDGIFTMEDNGCPGIPSSYKLTFFSNGDSLRLELIKDDCPGRGQGANNRVFGRVK